MVTYSRGTSVARSLKLLALPYSRSIKHINQHHCNPTRVVVIGESPYMTNNDNMEINWKERIAKYGNGIDLETAINDDLIEYMETKMYLYTQFNLTDYLLWIAF